MNSLRLLVIVTSFISVQYLDVAAQSDMQIVPFVRVQHEQFLRDVFGHDWGTNQHPGPRLMTAGDLAFTMPRVLGDTILIGEVEHAPVGLISFQPTPHDENGHWQIRMLYVDDAFRGKGFGAQLVQAAVERVRAIDHTGTIWLYVRRKNPGAQRLYERLGFTREYAKPFETWYVYTLSHDKKISPVSHTMAREVTAQKKPATERGSFHWSWYLAGLFFILFLLRQLIVPLLRKR